MKRIIFTIVLILNNRSSNDEGDEGDEGDDGVDDESVPIGLTVVYNWAQLLGIFSNLILI